MIRSMTHCEEYGHEEFSLVVTTAMKTSLEVILALTIFGAVWSDNVEDSEGRRRKAPWLEIPEPKTADPEKCPWQVAVIADDSFFCAGSLVSPKWVLTAAHCTLGYKVFELAIGSDQAIRHSTRSVSQHPDYKPDMLEKDLSLLELPEDVLLSRTVGVVRLPNFGHTNDEVEGLDLIMTGWGPLEDKLSIWADVLSPPLKWIRLRSTNDNACNSVYGRSFSPNKICLDTTASPHSEGILSLVDGGAPIVFKDADGNYTLVAILAFGPGHSTLRLPVVATRVEPFLSWINETTGIRVDDTNNNRERENSSV